MAQLPLQYMDIRVLLTKFTTFPIIFARIYGEIAQICIV